MVLPARHLAEDADGGGTGSRSGVGTHSRSSPGGQPLEPCSSPRRGNPTHGALGGELLPPTEGHPPSPEPPPGFAPPPGGKTFQGQPLEEKGSNGDEKGSKGAEMAPLRRRGSILRRGSCEDRGLDGPASGETSVEKGSKDRAGDSHRGGAGDVGNSSLEGTGRSGQISGGVGGLVKFSPDGGASGDAGSLVKLEQSGVCLTRRGSILRRGSVEGDGDAGRLDPQIRSRNPKPETRNPKPETRNPKPETQNPKPETRNSEPETRNPKPETRNPKPETRNPKPETRNPNPSTVGPQDLPGTCLESNSTPAPLEGHRGAIGTP